MFGIHKRIRLQTIKEKLTFRNQFRLLISLGLIGLFLVLEQQLVIKTLIEIDQQKEEQDGKNRSLAVPEQITTNVPSTTQDITTNINNHVESTLVSAYFQLSSSKHKANDYLDWLNNALCIEDAMVIFTTPDLVEHMRKLRQHAIEKTLIVPMNLKDIQVSTKVHYDDEFWKEKGGVYDDRDINLFKIWMAKSWFVNQAIDRNPFGSDVYSWIDSGHFRFGNHFCGKTVVRHPEIIPKDRVVLYPCRGLKYKIDQRNYDNRIFSGTFGKFFIAGGTISARVNPWRLFQEKIEESIDLYKQNSVSLHDDQPVLQSTCMRNPGLCAVVRWDAPFGTGDQHSKCSRHKIDFNCFVQNGGWAHHTISDFFSMSFRLHHGGDINKMYWDPAMGVPTKDEDPGLYPA